MKRYILWLRQWLKEMGERGSITYPPPIPKSYLDTDVTLAANSDTKVPSQKAVKTYVDAAGADPASAIHAASAKATPADLDELGLVNSAGGAWTLVKTTWAQIKAALKDYFDTLYHPKYPTAAAGGTVDAITATYSPAVTLTNGTRVTLVAAGANTGAVTFTPNALTTKAIVKYASTALVAGDIPAAGYVCHLEYNGTAWVLLNPSLETRLGGALPATSELYKGTGVAGVGEAAAAGTDYVAPTPDLSALADGGSYLIEGELAVYGEALTKFETAYRAADGKLYLQDTTDSTKVEDAGGFLILTTGVLDDEYTVMTRGYFRDESLAAGFSAHATIYGDPATPGGMTVTQPTTPTQQMKILGKVTGTAKICKFAPEVRVEVGRYTAASVDDYDLTTPIALANSLKTVMNAHAADATEHVTAADAVNFPVATANASNLATLIALTTALLTAYDAHDADAELGVGWAFHEGQETGDHSLASAVAPTTAGECVVRLLDIKAKFNAHDADASAHDAGSQHQEATADCVLAITPNLDEYLTYELTSLDTDLTVNEPIGTAVNLLSFLLLITDSGVSRTLTHDAVYEGSTTQPLTAATVASEGELHQFTYNLSRTKYLRTGSPGGYA